MRNFVASVVLFVSCWAGLVTNLAAASTSTAASSPYDYAKPRLLTGTLYAIGSHRKEVLYTFKRTATRSGAAVHVLRQFFTTNGTVAAVEKVAYQSNRLVSYEMQDFQAQVSGAIHIKPNPKNPARQKIFISYVHGLNPPLGRAHQLQPDTVIDDTLYPFMLDHWNDLMQGKTVKFHFVALDWERTFTFKLRETGQSEQNGKPVVQLTMKPASFFLSAFVRPIVFTVQKSRPHAILSYIGRTTPRIKKGNHWKYLNADTVFHYPAKDFSK